MTVSEYISALTNVKISDADGHDLKKKYEEKKKAEKK